MFPRRKKSFNLTLSVYENVLLDVSIAHPKRVEGEGWDLISEVAVGYMDTRPKIAFQGPMGQTVDETRRNTNKFNVPIDSPIRYKHVFKITTLESPLYNTWWRVEGPSEGLFGAAGVASFLVTQTLAPAGVPA